MTLPPASSIRYGGDYNPEQWPTETWDDDYAAFNAAHMNTLTVGVFMWSLIQPDETTYDFDVLDAIIDRAHAEDRQVVLATATAAVPHGWPPPTLTSTGSTLKDATTTTGNATTPATPHPTTGASPPNLRDASPSVTPTTLR